MARARAKGIFTCDHCHRNFTRKFALSRHIISIHINPSTSAQKNNMKCPECSYSSFNSMRINDHLIHTHQIELEENRLCFASEEEFQEWKEKMETETRSSFSRRTSTRIPRSLGAPIVVYYVCNRSGGRKKRNEERKRSKRVKGSCKTGTYCPARIKRYDKDGKIEILYCGVHIGHSHEIRYMRLPKSVEMLIVKKLQEGISLDQLLSEIRDEAVCSEILEKKHLLTRKALHNIIYKYKLSSVVKYHSEDVPKVEIPLINVKSEDANPILMYKKSNEPYDNLNLEDLMLVIMTEEQREMLLNFGGDKICIDSTNNSEKLKLQLTSVFVLDEFGVPFPACYCISNKVDENTLTMLFQEIKKMVGVIAAKVFMSDDSPYIYNSWKTVMTEAQNQIICKWYIDRAWRKGLDTLGSKEAKSEIYSFLRALLDETNKQEFENLLHNFLLKLDEEGFYDFKQFFVSNYTVRSKLWAACYREEAFLNTSIALEASHKALKTLYSKFCQDNRLDVIIQLLMKTIRDKTFNRKINLNEGPVNTHVNDILIRHDRARHIKKIYHVQDQEWLVESLSKNVKHFVRKKLDDCACQRKCLVCEVCVHMYTCSCDDYFISRNLCKHIHAICRSLESNDFLSASNPSVDMYEIEIATDDIASQMKEEEEVCSAEELFTSQLTQIRDMWKNGNGIEIKNPDNMRRLIELSSEMFNILSNEKNNTTSNITFTEVESLDQPFIPQLHLSADSTLLAGSTTIGQDKLETIIRRTIHDINLQ